MMMTYKQNHTVRVNPNSVVYFYSFLKSFLISKIEIPILYNRIIINKAIYWPSLISIDK